MILDTSFLIDFMNGDTKAISVFDALAKKQTPLMITTPTIFELFSGLSRSSKPATELSKIHAVLPNQSVWGLDAASAERAGRLHGSLIKKGQSIEAMDCLLAGIALEHHEPVLTRNVKHFSKVNGLDVQTY